MQQAGTREMRCEEERAREVKSENFSSKVRKMSWKPILRNTIKTESNTVTIIISAAKCIIFLASSQNRNSVLEI